MILNFILLKGEYSIYRFETNSPVPAWVYDSKFYSVTRTQDELSIVCEHVESTLDNIIEIARYWRILKIKGPLDLAMVGIISDISNLLKENNIAIFTISTYDTDYVLITSNNIEKAMKVLNSKNHKILIEK